MPYMMTLWEKRWGVGRHTTLRRQKEKEASDFGPSEREGSSERALRGFVGITLYGKVQVSMHGVGLGLLAS